VPEERVRCPTVHQDWRDVTFLHWRYEPDVVKTLLPEGLEPHVRDGVTWVGLTPFRVERFRLPLSPPVPRISSFPETNVRVYVLGPTGRDGIWFLTLEADSLITTVAARTGYGVAYRWAEMTVESLDGRVRYLSRGRGQRRSVGHDIEVAPGVPLGADEVGELDHWLTGRWRGWARVAGRLVEVPVQHEPWPLWRADVLKLEETVLAGVGLPEPEEPPVVHYSPGVDASLGLPRLRSSTSGRGPRIRD
jgi:uncharacterized protein YqjF (DUF2071 family)